MLTHPSTPNGAERGYSGAALFSRTDAGNGSNGICRVIDGCQRPPARPFGLPSASDVAPLHSCSLSPDLNRSALILAPERDKHHRNKKAMKHNPRFRRMFPTLKWFMVTLIMVIGSQNAMAKHPPSFPADVPPLLGMAMVTDEGKAGADSQWSVKLDLPKLKWEVVGEMVPKQQWPELKVEVEHATITLRMGGPSALAPSRIVDLQGNELNRDQVVKRLGKETPVLVSVSGRMPDAFYLQLTKPDALIVILGPRDGVPAAGLLPAEKTSSLKKEKTGDK